MPALAKAAAATSGALRRSAPDARCYGCPVARPQPRLGGRWVDGGRRLLRCFDGGAAAPGCVAAERAGDAARLVPNSGCLNVGSSSQWPPRLWPEYLPLRNGARPLRAVLPGLVGKGVPGWNFWCSGWRLPVAACSGPLAYCLTAPLRVVPSCYRPFPRQPRVVATAARPTATRTGRMAMATSSAP